MSSSALPDDLSPISDVREILQFMLEASKLSVPALLWARGEVEIIHTHVSTFNQIGKFLHLAIPKTVDFEKFASSLKTVHDECMISLSLPSAQILFKTHFEGRGEAGFRFTVPLPVYKFQRRKNARYKIPSGYLLKIEYQDPFKPQTILTKKALDLSLSGLSFAIDEKDLSGYPVGAVLKNMKFTVRRKLMTTDAEIRHIKPLRNHSPGGSLKVGVLFKSLGTSDMDLIASYVLAESTKQFAKFLY